MKRLFLYFLLFLSSSIFAQEAIIKSLETAIAIESNSGKKAVLMAKLAENTRFIDIKKSIELANSAISISKKRGTEKDLAYAYIYSVKVFKKADSIQRMVIVADSAVFLAEKLNSKILKGISYNHKGFVAMNLNEEQKSMLYFFKALGNLEGTNEYVVLAKTYYYIYGSYAEKGDLDNEQKYAELALKTALKSIDPDMICLAYQANGTYFSDKFQKSKNPEDFNQAIAYFENALSVFSKNSEKIIVQNQFGIVATNIADLYFQNYTPKSKDMILKYTDLALVDAKRHKDLVIIANCLNLKSELAIRENDFISAENLLLQSKDLVESRAFKDEYLRASVFHSLADFYENRKNPSLALIYLKKYTESYQNLNDTKKKSDIRTLEAKFQTQKKEEQLILLDEKAGLQKKQKYLFLALAFLILLGSFYLFRASNLKLTNERQQKLLLKKEKEEAELLAQLKEQETARIMAEQELLQTKQAQLQKELLAGTIQVEHKNKLLFNLKEKIADEQLSSKSTQKLNRIINQELNIDKDFDKIKNDFQNVHPLFFKKIQDITTQKLSTLDLKYCACIFMGLSTKQMALFFNVEPKSVRMSKYRLKQKLELARKTDLETFLKAVLDS